MCDISIIIPTYKPGSYIFKCLESILNQKINDFNYEIIVILNGVKEQYYNDIINYKKEFDFLNLIKLQFNEIGSVSIARNVGLNISKGDFIVFIDDDDVISPNYLNGLFEKARLNSIVFSNVLNFKNNIEHTEEDWLTKIHRRNSLNKTNSIHTYRRHMSFVWGKLISKQVIDNYRFNSRFITSEDAIFMAAISKNIKFFKTSSTDSIYLRRQRFDSASRKKRSFKYYITNTFQVTMAFISIYFSDPLRYNLFFLYQD